MVFWGQRVTAHFQKSHFPWQVTDTTFTLSQTHWQAKVIFPCCTPQLLPTHLESRDATEAALGWRRQQA